LRDALSPEDIRRLINPPGFGAGVTIDPPEPLIFVPNPVPVPDKDVLPIPEFNFPTHTGAPPQIVNAGPHITPVPDELPGGYAVYSARGTEFDKAGGWQGTSVPEDTLKANNPSVAVIEQAWRDAHANLGGYAGTAVSGSQLHAEVARLLKKKGFQSEVSVSPAGDAEITYGRPGSIRLDVPEVRGNDLVIYDFKAGNATLPRKRIEEIKDRAVKIDNNGRPFDKITIIEVKL
jgi:hypothetical protein